jgi:DNA-binding MurR/RpiR family transcriptional regulator
MEGAREVGNGQGLSAAILGPLKDGYEQLTRAEKKVANYLLAQPNRVILEPASTVARNVGVSPMTVGRLLRKLGFEGLSDIRRRLKTDLYGPDGGTVWSIDRRYEAFAQRRAQNFSLEDSLAAELAAIRQAYELTTTKLWDRVVRTVATAERVHVSGLHMAQGLALELVRRLEYIRAGVRLADGQNGHYADVLGEPARKSCLILIDFYRYDRATQRLAKAAKERGFEVIIFTDSYCLWAREVTELAFGLPTSTGLFWHSTGAYSVLLNLLVNAVVERLGDRVPQRFEGMLEAQKLFDQFAEDL